MSALQVAVALEQIELVRKITGYYHRLGELLYRNVKPLPGAELMPVSQKNHLFLAALIAVASCLSSAAQVLPPERSFISAWHASGAAQVTPPERIVNVRDFGATGDGVTDDAPSVIAAIRSISDAGGVVYFPPGTYQMESNLSFGSRIVLRGHRPQTTTLRFNTLWHCISITGKRNGKWQSIKSGHDLHSAALEVEDGSAFKAGDIAETHQDLDQEWKGVTWDACGQIIRIIGVSGNTLQLEQPLRLQYKAELSPRLRSIQPAVQSGIENLRIERLLLGSGQQRNNHFNIRLFATADCTIRGVESVNAWGGHIGLEYSSRSEVTGCYLHHAWDYDGGGSGYGTRLEFKTSECRIENNILHTLRHALLQQAFVNGNVIAYNYSFDVKSDAHRTEAGDICMHGNYPYANLFEGNIVQHIWIDNSHGANGPYNLYFRNRVERNGFNMTDPGGHRQSVIGNELFRGGPMVRLGIGNGYRFLGSDHFTYGNQTVSNGIQPEGTGTLNDRSYYLTNDPEADFTLPDWWTLPEPIPTIGLPHLLDAPKRIPALARWEAGGVLTVGPPSLYRQPVSQEVQAGDPTVFSVGAVGTPSVEIQWTHNRQALPGATGHQLRIEKASPSDAGAYHALITDSGGKIQSATAHLTIRQAP